ncbi:hypothetical protein [Oceaniglobus trochenteri]|uniref:hypothetical protein n=1 Tax=Oceaniglobus trochenteri TaxID=2763260 RepID=UPI001CFF63DC|nr:hypothetical protein [Oceaniglobus trochenteri]
MIGLANLTPTQQAYIASLNHSRLDRATGGGGCILPDHAPAKKDAALLSAHGTTWGQPINRAEIAKAERMNT